MGLVEGMNDVMEEDEASKRCGRISSGGMNQGRGHNNLISQCEPMKTAQIVWAFFLCSSGVNWHLPGARVLMSWCAVTF